MISEEINKKEIKYAFSLLCRNINEISLKILQIMTLLEKYENYDFFIFIDNNNQNISHLQSKYTKFHFLQINDKTCFNNGYHHMTFSITKTPVSWDKAIYYFSELNDQYDYIWFIEDDVFIPNPLLIYNIDQTHKDYHLLSKSNTVCFNYDEPSWQWYAAKGKIGLPLFSSLMCASRISQTLLHIIRDYVRKNKQLFFLEIMFPTLCCQNKLPNKCIPQLSMIEYRKVWNYQDIQPYFMYHPIKDLTIQKAYFEQMNKIRLL
jgi:hypothetical protein